VKAIWTLQAHHPDISKDLDVEWLCLSCHGKADNPPRNPALMERFEKYTATLPPERSENWGLLLRKSFAGDKLDGFLTSSGF